jgi:hypothetical protein
LNTAFYFALAYNSRTGTDTRSELGTRFDRALALYCNAVLAARAACPFICDALETDWLAGVVGFELQNPSGLKSVRVAAIILPDLAKSVAQRRFQ